MSSTTAARALRKRSKRGELGSNLTQHWQLLLMTLPALIYLIVFCYKPMYGLQIAFKDYKLKLGILGSEWSDPLFKNFTRLFDSYWFPIILKNTLTISLLSLIVSFPMPIILALMVNEMKNEKLKRIFQTVSYAPHFISTIVICGMVILFTSPSSGIINKAIEAFGGEPIAFMQSNSWFKWVYVLSGVWQGTGWGAIIYFAALSGVDQSLLEAADIDGASRFQKIVYINFPVLVPTILTLLILQCGSLLNLGYEKVYALQNATNIPASEVISTYVYKVGLEKKDFSFSTAAGLFNSVINCVILITANTLSKKLSSTSLW